MNVRRGSALFAALVFTFAAPFAALAQDPVTPATLEGVWKLVSMTMDGKPVPASGYTIFQDEYFSYITTFERDELTAQAGDEPAEALDADQRTLRAYRTMTAAAGTYRVEGDAIAFIQDVTRTPALAGGVKMRRFELDGDRFLQDFEGGGRRRVIVWERVSPPE